MPHQEALTVRAPIRPGRQDELAELLATMRSEGAGGNSVLPLAEATGVHFARLFVTDAATDLAGDQLPACLFYMADVDGPVDRHILELATRFATGIDTLFGCCDGYPDNLATPGHRVAWLGERMAAPAATYVHQIGRSVDQVHAERRLRDSIQSHLDRPDVMPVELSASDAHDRIRSFVLRRTDLRWARRRARGVGLSHRVRSAVHLIGLPLVVLLTWPFLVPAIVVLLVLIRWKERRDVPESGPPPAEHVHALEATEDHGAQNPFTAIGLVKAGRLRRLTIRLVLLVLDWTNRHVFGRDNLAGVRTIHFARWVPVDDGRRLIFASSYDGTLESYMDDFIDRLAGGLNAVFSNGVGYPVTRWLVLDGANDETAFKNYLRRHQVVTPVWYSAYDTMPARNLDAASIIRRDLTRDLDEPSADEWMALL